MVVSALISQAISADVMTCAVCQCYITFFSALGTVGSLPRLQSWKAWVCCWGFILGEVWSTQRIYAHRNREVRFNTRFVLGLLDLSVVRVMKKICC